MIDYIVTLIYYAVIGFASLILSQLILDRISERTVLSNDRRVLCWIGIFCGLVYGMVMILLIGRNLLIGRVPRSILEIILGPLFVFIGPFPPSFSTTLIGAPPPPRLIFLATLLIGIFFEIRYKPRPLQSSE